MNGGLEADARGSAPRTLVLSIRTGDDAVEVRKSIRETAQQLGMGLIACTKLVTAASELARNVLDHAGGGRCEVTVISSGGRRAVQAVFIDSGPGIENIKEALGDGYSTGNGLGMGLGGSKRLVNEFEIESEVGQGTRITIRQWI